DVSWKPITEEELKTEVEQALATMPEEARRQFADIRISPLKLRCQRNGLIGEETLYAIAGRGRQYIVYDDVEDDFGLAVLSSSDRDETLRFWVLAGALSTAMRVLESGDYSACLLAP
ncbi:MAG: hypothetical protein LBF91_03160, partial [Azoarcus sp.]|nr:hypothetical protein [Azoarcus sp.]